LSFLDLIRRGESFEKSFDDLQSEMAEAVEESMALEGLSLVKAEATEAEPAEATQPDGESRPDAEAASAEPTEPDADLVTALAEEALAPIDVDVAPSPGEPAVPAVVENGGSGKRMTAHTQTRLAALESFEKLHRDAQEHLQQIDAKIAEVTTSQQLTRRFFNILLTDIHRANDLEIANAAYASEQKKLAEQFADSGRKLQERDGTIDALRQREASLAQDNEALRAALAGAKLELVEAGNAAVRIEAKLGEVLKTLSASTLEAERSARENEALREKQVGLTVELDKALKREAEAMRRADELATIHANESVRHSEMLAQIGKNEKEVVRLQMALESAQMRHSEMEEAALIADADREAEGQRALAELRGLRSETETLQAQLDLATQEQNAAADEIARLKAALSDAQSERQVTDERVAALLREQEKDKLDLSTATARIAHLTLQQETEQIQLDIQRQECEDLRAEIASLNARIKELLPFERLYRVTRAREHEGGNGEAIETGAVKARAANRRPSTNRAARQ
jgi:hypothetical protein